MDFSLQVHGAKYVFPIPDGLKELSSDIIREVLRHQPNNINGFIADYLETMLTVREHARDSGVAICDAFTESYFFDELFKKKNVTREQANVYATTIQAAWRGYVVRRKISEWLKKKKKFEEEKAVRKSIRIEELLAGLGITYDEAKRAAGVIQSAYRDSKQGKFISSEFGEFWMGEVVPFGKRIREGDRVQGRFDKWSKEDFGDFFEMDESGAIKYVWPRVGQLRKVLREEVPRGVPIVEFFSMRDLNGQEQYSYLIKSGPEAELRGTPIGFLEPVLKTCVQDYCQEAEFTCPQNSMKMGPYTYIFRDDITRKELANFKEIFETNEKLNASLESYGELDYDPNWVLPRVLVRIKKQLLLETDNELKFSSLPHGVVCEQENYTFRAETFELTKKIIKHILRSKCLTIEEGLLEASNMKPYKSQETGRIFPVDTFSIPKFIQKIEITPESATAEDESLDLINYNYIFLPLNYHASKKLPKGMSTFSIPIIRFQGYHSDYKGSSELENKVFVMGPKVTTPDGKPFTYESVFWDEFGEEAWYQLLYNLDLVERQGEGEEKEEEAGEHEEDSVMKVETDEPTLSVTAEKATDELESVVSTAEETSEKAVSAVAPPPSEPTAKAKGEAESAEESAAENKSEKEKEEPEPENTQDENETVTVQEEPKAE